ncbi:unnamed protein product [Rhizoctonia solani]|uniref:DJ-1/PfpI domain-containing protein n=1 Tax=Rhizoctonia solani TaxID=456999 RepID=A0A8H3HM77_9AGAM|nr:unnamed protein product [Rhizoctonia solani]
MSEPQVLSIAVVLYPNNALLDIQGTMELLETAGVNCASGAFFESLPEFPKPNVKFESEYIAETREPIRGVAGPPIVATKTLDEVASKQFDIILIPGGIVKPEEMPQSVVEFVRAQVPGAQYVLTVCTGSWLLASLGLLDGKRATSNKFFFNEIKKTTSPTVEWMARSRWVVDGKIWTASGVSAGQDMAYEFLEKVAGPEFATAVKGVVGLRATSHGVDELADIFKLT